VVGRVLDFKREFCVSPHSVTEWTLHTYTLYALHTDPESSLARTHRHRRSLMCEL
jgi:hypothetical protein